MDNTRENDLERGYELRSPPPLPPSILSSSTVTSARRCITWKYPAWLGAKRTPDDSPEEQGHEPPVVQIEDYRPGYPRYSALIASHNSFFVCRRFSLLRAHLLLDKQDRLSELEEKLLKINENERKSLYLGCHRRDRNQERTVVLREIAEAMADYDAFIKSLHEILKLGEAPTRSVANLQNWLQANPVIARNEVSYLEHSEDLISLAIPDDSALAWLDNMVTNIWVCCRVRRDKNRSQAISRDERVHIFPAQVTIRTARIFMIPLVVLFLLVPVVVCILVTNLTARLVLIIVATAGFVTGLSSMTQARTVELIVASVTYITVLIVFVSNANGPGS